MVIVSITSWCKRIEYVKQVIESIMNNTVKPDRVYLNLSEVEFSDVELPKDLVEYFESDERLFINWVSGENTKTMKKVFPILEYLNDDDIIITADDDILFPKDLIESRINDFEKFGRKYSITSNENSIGIFKGMNIASAVSLYTKRMLNNWEKYVNEDIIKTYNDDRTYVYLLWLNGYLNKSCTKYNVKELLKNYGQSLNETSISASKQVIFAKNYDIVANKRLEQIANKNISELFGFFQTQQKHDCVFVYGKSGLNSNEMTCGDYLEMEYVIASLKKYCSSWVGRIFIVGSEPPERVKNDVIHVPCDNPYTHCKDANIIHKLRYACENIPDLSEDFLMISDDQIVTKESSWEDMKPRIVRRFNGWNSSKWNKWANSGLPDMWQTQLYNTLKLFQKDKSCFWEPHIWSPINKKKFLDMCNTYDYEHKTNCIILSLYYNFIEQEIVNGFDHHYMGNSKDRVIKWLNMNTVESVPRHLAWTDTAFEEKRFRDMLDIIVGFRSNVEVKKIKDNLDINSTIIPNSRETIQKIRDGIRNGTIVKEMKPDGTYIWKKVRK